MHMIYVYVYVCSDKCIQQSKETAVRAWMGLEGSKGLRLADLMTIGTCTWLCCQSYAPATFTYHENLLVPIFVTGRVDPRAIVKYFNYSTGNRNRDLLVCSAVPQSTGPPRSPMCKYAQLNNTWLLSSFQMSIIIILKYL